MKAVKPKRTAGPKTHNPQGGKPFLKGLFYWAIPAGMTLGVLFLALNMMPNDWFSFLKPGFQSEIMAESAIVVIPPEPPVSGTLKTNEKNQLPPPVSSPQSDPWVMATYQALAQKMQGPEMRQKLQKQLLAKSFHAATDGVKTGAEATEKELALSDYQFKWVLQPDQYTMKIQVQGKDEKMALALANGLAQALVEEYQANATSIAEKLADTSDYSGLHKASSGAWVEEIPQGSPEAKLIQSIETQMKNAKDKLSEVNHALDNHPLKPILHDPQSSESVLPTVIESLSHRLQQTQKAYVSDEHTFQQLLKQLGVSPSQFSEKEALFIQQFSQDVLLNTLQDEWKQTQLKLNAIAGQAEQTHQDLALYPEIPKLKKYQALLQNNMKDRVSVLLKKSKVEPKRIFDLPPQDSTVPENPSGEALFPLSKTAKKAWLPTDGGNLYVQLAETSVHLKGAESKIHAIQHQVKQLKSEQTSSQSHASHQSSHTSKSYGALEREKRYLERQIDFMATLLASHRAPQGQIGAPEFPLAKIKYPARLETPQSTTAWGVPMVALVCVFLLGVLVLQKEKIHWVGSPDFFNYLPVEGLEDSIPGSLVKNAPTSLKERVVSLMMPPSGER
ncbi:MAG: hypothetical protein K2X66_07645, partial [Cyanobacteria bacterium]|nr:hypothetical protein [Cyanobacteriota bacterium]